jgi:multidrug efflux pump subunit AcrA (membrane-fusion protein)
VSDASPSTPRWNAGWILVVVLLSASVLGTWLTARSYHSRVFSSTRAAVIETSTNAAVLQNQWPESRIRAEFTPAEASRIRPGMMARITVGSDSTLLTGNVLTVGSGAESGIVIVSLNGEARDSGRVPIVAPGKKHHYLPAGASCAVTIDGTVPPEALATPVPAAL